MKLKRTCRNCHARGVENKYAKRPCRDCLRRPGVEDKHCTDEEWEKLMKQRGISNLF